MKCSRCLVDIGIREEMSVRGKQLKVMAIMIKGSMTSSSNNEKFNKADIERGNERIEFENC
jgi:hypothetical protein